MALAKPADLVRQPVRLRVLRPLRIRAARAAHQHRLSPEELRTVVLEGGNFIPQKHKSILLNLFDLEKISVEDIMTPRAQIEALNLAMPVEDIKQPADHLLPQQAAGLRRRDQPDRRHPARAQGGRPAEPGRRTDGRALPRC
jgi:Mg2+/Co2+ transporter CorB